MEEWKTTLSKVKGTAHSGARCVQRSASRWVPPAVNVLKVNVDASFSSNSSNFKVGIL